jgi:hypothetical protein
VAAGGALVFGATVSGVAGAGDLDLSVPDEASVGGSWTVLHYSMSDNDLEPYMMVDVEEMGEVGSNEDLDIVAMIDRSPDYLNYPVLGIDDWAGGLVVHVQPGHGEVVEDLGEIDMGDPATLASFVTPASPTSRPSTMR